jgi:hypothetical protein
MEFLPDRLIGTPLEEKKCTVWKPTTSDKILKILSFGWYKPHPEETKCKFKLGDVFKADVDNID